MSTTAQAEISKQSHLEQKQIWVVGKEPLTGELGQTLERIGFSPSFTHDPQEVLAEIGGGQSHIVLCDIRVRDMDGLTFLTEALRRNARVQVILMSDCYSADSAIEAVKRGAYDYLPKPVQRSRLTRTLEDLSDQLRRNQNIRQLEQQLTREMDCHGIVARGPAMLEVCDEARRMARHYTDILLAGPSGTGKKRLAQAIHQLSPVGNQRFVACQCSVLTEGMLENQLLGHGRGVSAVVPSGEGGGFPEDANGGTIYLDEVGEAPLSVQAELLHTVENRATPRFGSSAARRVEVRIVAGTRHDLREEVLAGRFREDLFCRLSTAQIRVPSLAERREDVPALAEFFLNRYNEIHHKRIEGITRSAMNALMQYPWPGNVRELETIVSSAVLADGRSLIDIGDLPEHVRKSPTGRIGDRAWQPLPLKEIRREHIERVLEACHGNRVRAAQLLGIGRTSLYRYLKRRTKSHSNTEIHAA